MEKGKAESIYEIQNPRFDRYLRFVTKIDRVIVFLRVLMRVERLLQRINSGGLRPNEAMRCCLASN